MKKVSETRTDLWLKFGLACDALKEDLERIVEAEISVRSMPNDVDVSAMTEGEFNALVEHITGTRGTWNLRR